MREWMAEARKARKITQGELGRTVGVSQRSIAAYEAGERTPGTGKAKKIGAALDVSWTRFYEDEGADPAEDSEEEGG